MNRITAAERARLVTLAKQAITLDAAGEIVDGFTPAWRRFAAEHGISDQRAREYVAKAARLLRGEIAKPGPGRPATMEPGAPITVWLTPAHVRTATKTGQGNVSAGVRTALEDWERKELT
jgi:hypothetical protein